MKQLMALAAWAALGAAGLAACAAPAVGPAAPRAAGAAPERDALAAAIGDAACTEDVQCRTVPVGRKACGGPQAWWAWSTAQGDGARIAQAAARYTQASSAAVQESGRMSTCSIVPDPGAVCTAGRCTLRVPALLR
ncbi:hypothetical protein V4F39_07080 [Aquincola sp. MAHUQ-54]|uniref:DUF4189 domain-containing protein n=1 Tax=Aquincola agrisoli TaxID=3119538 RepID=A0AAW9QF36_9BURK